MGLMDSFTRLFGISKPAAHAAGGPVAIDVSDAPSARDVKPSQAWNNKDLGTAIHADEDLGQSIESGRMAVANSPEPKPLARGSVDVNGSSSSRSSLTPQQIKSRQELFNELKKNYSEVLTLCRKVDDHLDQQSARSDRMLQIAERTTETLAVLPELRDQNARIADAISSLADAVRGGDDRAHSMAERFNQTATAQLESLQQQTTALQKVQSSIHASTEAEIQMAKGFDGVRDTMTGVAKATSDLGTTIAAMRETDAERETELTKLVLKGQRTLFISALAVGVLAIVALGAVLLGRI